MKQELTAKQEEIMLEAGREQDFERKCEIFVQDVGQKKCEVCGEYYLDVEIRKAIIDEQEGEICVYCIENMQLN